jgi:hypothetical protein
MDAVANGSVNHDLETVLANTNLDAVDWM